MYEVIRREAMSVACNRDAGRVGTGHVGATMIDYFQKLLGARGLAPHGFCLLWDPALIWTHVISDALIGVAYFSIPVALGYFLIRRRDVAFGWVAWLFAAFITACGVTHFLSIWVLWNPDYGPEALVKAITAAVSVATAIALWPLLPRAIALPSPAMLRRANDDLRTGISERDAALSALARETTERLRTEAMLRQSQKMEAIGQLTSGIAHDFNNLLTVVIANLDRVQRLPEGDERSRGAVANALVGAQRAATLTDQLLSFARKQPLQPVAQNLNPVVLQVSSLAAAALPKSVRIETDLADALWPVAIDTAQTEAAVLNLLVNARDAMPDGGSITIRTRNQPDGSHPAQPAGDHVMLEVVDSGCGMSPATIEHAFEPFFTTKNVGEGTGLGLSQVYGLVKQSAGQIQIDSAPGEGTIIRIFLPRS